MLKSFARKNITLKAIPCNNESSGKTNQHTGLLWELRFRGVIQNYYR
jgi:hypothetical protein